MQAAFTELASRTRLPSSLTEDQVCANPHGLHERLEGRRSVFAPIDLVLVLGSFGSAAHQLSLWTVPYLATPAICPKEPPKDVRFVLLSHLTAHPPVRRFAGRFGGSNFC